MDREQYKEHLNQMMERVDDPIEGFFGTGSMAWKVNREFVIGLGAMRALLMQVAHPAVAQGVADHSDYARRPFKRAYTTMKSQQEIVFGDCKEAIMTLERVFARHTAVQGSVLLNSTEEVQYSGNDVNLKLWVHATLIDSVMWAYQTFLPRLSEFEIRQFYQESILFAELMGIPVEIVPTTYPKLVEWMDDMVYRGEVKVNDQARKIGESLLWLPIRPAKPFNYVLAAVSLPTAIREQYGFKLGRLNSAVFNLGAQGVRIGMRLLPRRLRITPPYWRASKRSMK